MSVLTNTYRETIHFQISRNSISGTLNGLLKSSPSMLVLQTGRSEDAPLSFRPLHVTRLLTKKVLQRTSAYIPATSSYLQRQLVPGHSCKGGSQRPKRFERLNDFAAGQGRRRLWRAGHYFGISC